MKLRWFLKKINQQTSSQPHQEEKRGPKQTK